MQIEQERIGELVLIRIHEKTLTSNEAPEMKTTMLRFLLEDGEVFILNLKEVEYMDSTGLGAFLFGLRQAERYDKDFVFCEVNPRIQSLIRIAHLDGILEMYKTEKEAIKAIQKDEK